MYLGVKFVKRKEFIKCGLGLLGVLNVERKAQFCVITNEAYKLKRLYVKFIVVLFLFLLVRKMCAYSILDLVGNRLFTSDVTTIDW